MNPATFCLLSVYIDIFLGSNWLTEDFSFGLFAARNIESLKNTSGSAGPILRPWNISFLFAHLFLLTLPLLLAVDVHQPSSQTTILRTCSLVIEVVRLDRSVRVLLFIDDNHLWKELGEGVPLKRIIILFYICEAFVEDASATRLLLFNHLRCFFLLHLFVFLRKHGIESGSRSNRHRFILWEDSLTDIWDLSVLIASRRTPLK